MFSIRDQVEALVRLEVRDVGDEKPDAAPALRRLRARLRHHLGGDVDADELRIGIARGEPERGGPRFAARCRTPSMATPSASA
jgi:hypothetical protein